MRGEGGKESWRESGEGGEEERLGGAWLIKQTQVNPRTLPRGPGQYVFLLSAVWEGMCDYPLLPSGSPPLFLYPFLEGLFYLAVSWNLHQLCFGRRISLPSFRLTSLSSSGPSIPRVFGFVRCEGRLF